MKIITFVGDSHTWGQGVEGESHFNPATVGGEPRYMPFSYPCYVNLVRQMVNEFTNSSAEDIEPVNQCEFEITRKAGLFRIELHAFKAETIAEIRLDGELYSKIEVPFPNENYAYTTVPIFCDETQTHTLNIKGANIYRVEIYSGTHAVINAGVGSCPLEKYMNIFWNDYVAAYTPYVVIHEGNVINDWLTKETPERYYELLTGILQATKTIGAIPILHTNAPINGNQSQPFNDYDFESFVEKQREAANSTGVLFTDTNLAMKNILSDDLFSDDWHVNKLGHKIYADNIMKLLRNLLY